MVRSSKDKLFFFADYEAERFDFPKTTNNISVFTAKERQGDVSELVAAGKAIVDPLTGQPFPNNVIPQNRLSPAALAILNSKYYPTPINGLLQSNAHNTVATKTNDDQGDGRLDYAAERKRPFHGPLLVREHNQPHHQLVRIFSTTHTTSFWDGTLSLAIRAICPQIP